MTEPLLHVLFTPSGAGTLRQVLAQQGRGERVVCLFDDFSFGPLKSDDAARVAWVEHELDIPDRETVTATTAPFLLTACSPGVMPIAWISRRDARSHAGFLWWLSHLGDAPCKIVDVTARAISPASLLPEEMSPLLGTEIAFDAAERARDRARWHSLLLENAPFRVIDREGTLVSASIDHFDPLLLAASVPTWRKMARIVGEVLGGFLIDGPFQAGDLVLCGRARAVAESGALEWRGDLSSIQGCELRLPATRSV